MKNLPPVVPARSRVPVPAGWKREIRSILIGEKQIARRVRELSRKIEADYFGRPDILKTLRRNAHIIQEYEGVMDLVELKI